jgi:coenzyme F420-reducing hydrogenase beta subunit
MAAISILYTVFTQNPIMQAMLLQKLITAACLPVPLRAIICLQRSSTQKKVPTKVWPFIGTFCTGNPDFFDHFSNFLFFTLALPLSHDSDTCH